MAESKRLQRLHEARLKLKNQINDENVKLARKERRALIRIQIKIGELIQRHVEFDSLEDLEAKISQWTYMVPEDVQESLDDDRVIMGSINGSLASVVDPEEDVLAVDEDAGRPAPEAPGSRQSFSRLFTRGTT